MYGGEKAPKINSRQEVCMLHEVYVFAKNDVKDFSKKRLMTWGEFRELLKTQDETTTIMRYNRKKNEWFKYEK